MMRRARSKAPSRLVCRFRDSEYCLAAFSCGLGLSVGLNMLLQCAGRQTEAGSFAGPVLADFGLFAGGCRGHAATNVPGPQREVVGVNAPAAVTGPREHVLIREVAVSVLPGKHSGPAWAIVAHVERVSPAGATPEPATVGFDRDQVLEVLGTLKQSLVHGWHRSAPGRRYG